MKKIYLLSIILMLSFSVYSQRIKSISPDSANANQRLNVVVTCSGTHFTKGSININGAYTSSIYLFFT